MMIHRNSRIALAVLLAVSLVVTVACNVSDAVRNLQFVIAAAEVVVPIVLAGNTVPLPPETKVAVISYLVAVGKATDISAAALADPAKTKAQKGTMIAAAFAGAIAPNLPPGTPANIVATIQAVSEAIGKFLNSVVLPQTPGGVAMAEAQTQTPAKVSRADKQVLDEIGRRSRALRTAVRP